MSDLIFQNNVPDPLLSEKELPSFKFELEKSKGKVLGNSFGKEATIEQLPISKGIAGVSMQLEPGVMRELHWHATAAEWAFVLKNRVRTTVINPAGQTETNDFEPGDIWYFPRGHPHMLECLGNEPTHFILIFDNGYFSEFGTSLIGSGMRPSRYWQKISTCLNQHLMAFQRKRFTLRAGAFRPSKFRKICRGLVSRHRRRTNFECLPVHRTRFSRAAGNGASIPRDFQFRLPLPA
jgi:oxalate decarboxylase/phosphoglucose isomerase-like protein (cupin superfamily)